MKDISKMSKDEILNRLTELKKEEQLMQLKIIDRQKKEIIEKLDRNLIDRCILNVSIRRRLAEEAKQEKKEIKIENVKKEALVNFKPFYI